MSVEPTAPYAWFFVRGVFTNTDAVNAANNVKKLLQIETRNVNMVNATVTVIANPDVRQNDSMVLISGLSYGELYAITRGIQMNTLQTTVPVQFRGSTPDAAGHYPTYIGRNHLFLRTLNRWHITPPFVSLFFVVIAVGLAALGFVLHGAKLSTGVYITAFMFMAIGIMLLIDTKIVNTTTQQREAFDKAFVDPSRISTAYAEGDSNETITHACVRWYTDPFRGSGGLCSESDASGNWGGQQFNA